MDRGAWLSTVMELQRVGHNLACTQDRNLYAKKAVIFQCVIPINQTIHW